MVEQAELKKKIFSGVLWHGIGMISLKLLRFIIAVILARLLAPEEFGIITIAGFFLLLCETFIDCGFSAAIIQRENLTDRECSSVFWVNLIFSVIFYGLLCGGAPFIARFYRSEILSPVLRVIGLLLIINSFTLIHRSLLVKKLDFKHNAIVRWAALVLGGSIAIAMAFMGYGIWALVAEYLAGEIVKLVLYPYFSKYKIMFHCDLREVKDLFTYGYKLLLENILLATQKNLSTLVLGKIVSIHQMSFFSRGYAYPQLLSDTLDGTFRDVIFSAMSASQSDPQTLKKIRNQTLQLSTWFSFPALTLLAVSASELIPIMLTDKWIPCIVYLRIACIDVAILSMWSILQQQFNAIGKSGITLSVRLIFFFTASVIYLFVITRQYCFGKAASILSISIALVCGNMLSMIPLFCLSKRYLNFSFFRDFIPCIWKNLFTSLTCGAIVALCFKFQPIPSRYLLLGAKICLFVFLYLLATYLFQRKIFTSGFHKKIAI